MHIFVLKGECVTVFLQNSKLSVFQFEVYTGSCRISLDAGNSSLIEFATIRCQVFGFRIRGQCRLADLQKSLMSIVGHTENIYEFVFIGTIKLFHVFCSSQSGQ